MPMEPTTAGPRSERMSPKRLEPTTTSNQSGMADEVSGKNIDVILVRADVRIFRRHGTEAFVPKRHGMNDAV